MAGFESFCIVELMGHARIAGKVSEQVIAGTAMLRVDVPKTGRKEAFTKYYSPSAVYSITPTDEATAQRAAEAFDEAPIQPWILRMPTSPLLADGFVAGGDTDPLRGRNQVVIEEEEDYDDEETDDWGYPPSHPFYDPELDDPDNGYSDDEDEILPLDDDEPIFGSETWREEQKQKVVALCRELARQQFVIFDTETTGFESSDEIVQIGVIDQDGKTLLDSLVKPTKPITNSDRHGITDEMVKDAPTFPEVYDQIKAALSGKLVLAYNSAFDWRMLDQVCDQHGLACVTPLARECVMELYATFHGAWSDYHQSFTWQKLGAACERLGVPVEQEHQALKDCILALGVLRKMAESVEKIEVK